MVHPEIKYCTSEEGLSIAYWTMGSGSPLVISPPFGFGHIQLELEDPELQAWYERLAEHHMVVRFDPPGQGLAQRGLSRSQWLSVGPYTVMDALVQALDVDQVDLIGCGQGGFAACDFAARDPHRVRRLVLWVVPPDGQNWGSTEIGAAMATGQIDWATFTETFAHAVLGWSQKDRASQWARFMRRAMDGEDFMLGMEAAPEFPDAADVLSRISSPTLVIYPSVGRSINTQAAQRLTAAIQGSRLVLIPSRRG